MNADGSDQTNLTNNSGDDSSRPGRRTAPRSRSRAIRDGNDEIYVMNADGSNQTNLTNNPADDYAPGLVAGRHQDRLHRAPATATSRST